ncbi:MAG: HK97 gp10 family phage protein [Adlercreutzia sp.]
MPSTISPDSLASSMARIVKSYAAEERKDAGEAVKKTARKTVQRLKKTSPKKKGGYSKGWRSKVEEGIGAGSTAVISTRKPGEAHLLEKARKRDGGSCANPAHRTGIQQQ